jgi:VWFA-related protein
MQLRSMLLLAAAMLAASAVARAQDANAQAPAPSAVIKTETRVVLVDTVVQDKKGQYVRDLEQKDFKVFEDNKEQKVTSFSFEADPNSPNNNQKHYMVLLFDNATMDFGMQALARKAAAQFIDANAGPNRLMAIINYGGSISVAQNFTADADRLKKVVSGVGFSTVSPNAPVDVASTGMPGSGMSGIPVPGIPSLGGAEAAFGLRDELLALRSMAKLLAPIPGRKMVVFLTGGFVVPAEDMSELTAAIAECNRANVAIYPIDVRGLVTGMSAGPTGASLWSPSSPQLVQLIPASFHPSNSLGAAFFQHGGGGGGGGTGGGGGGTGGGGHSGGGGTGGGTGGGGGHSGGGTGGGTGGGHTGGGAPSNPNNGLNNNTLNPYNNSRNLIPPFPATASTNQMVLYALADGTGGFVILNTNDLLGGLEKIGKEQDQFYLLGYTPPESAEGTCHFIKVKLDRPGTSVRFRNGYCNVKAVDVLSGNPVEKDLESRVAGSAPGIPGVSIQAPYFYSANNTARVDVALSFPAENIKFEKAHGKLHAEVNILAIAYRPDGSVAARFSDNKKIEVENKKELEVLAARPYYYDGQFDIASGQYTLKAAFSSGGPNFGKVEMPLAIEPYNSKEFGLGALALSKDLRKASDSGSDLDAVLLEGRTPLIAQGYQFMPAAANRFKTTDHVALYTEIYEPHATDKTLPIVGVQLRVLDRKTQEVKQDSGLFSVSKEIRTGDAVIPVGMKVPTDTLAPGAYRAEVTAKDQFNKMKTRTVDFDIE